MPIILGIKISEITPKEILNEIENLMSFKKSSFIVTPNPEIILASHEDEELFYILNKADLALADGFGLVIAGLFQGSKIKRITGSDLTPKLLKEAELKNKKVFIANWQDGLSKKNDISNVLEKKYPALKFLVLDLERGIELKESDLEIINSFAPEIMFCTFGSPYQEKFIFHNKEKIKSLYLSLAVGGSFDFLSGKIIRAPKIFRIIGFEWLWRLILQPKRWRRIYRATFVFLSKALKANFKHFFYRPNVACLLYRNTNNFEKEILLIERRDDKGHWQIPQGGTDGESLKEAGSRELREELNTDKFIIRASYKNLFRYLFPNLEVEKNRVKNAQYKYKFDYKGQKQGLIIAEFTGQDSDIKVNFWEHLNFKWVKESEFVNSVHRVRQESAKIFLEKLQKLSDKS